LAAPGGIWVSGDVYRQCRGKMNVEFEDLGEREVKNIAEPVRAYSVSPEVARERLQQAETADPLPLPDKPSIAVLAFDNMSGDPEQEYFADGIAEDIITGLSRIRWFFVIARNSSFSYRGKTVDVKQAARDLGVQYVLEGSVRKAGNRVRISAQLIDGSTGNHLWAERYDRGLEDIFDLQDELTEAIVGAIQPEMAKSEQQRARTKPTDNLGAWDLYHRGTWHLDRQSKDDLAEAERLFKRAIQLDKNFGPAFAGLAEAHTHEVLYRLSDRDLNEALSSARRAIQLDDEDPIAHNALGHVHFIERDHEAAIAEFQLAIRLNPSFAWAYHNLGTALAHSGKAADAIPQLHTALRLSPRDPRIARIYARLACANLFLKLHEEAMEWGTKSLRHPGTQWRMHTYLLSALGHLERMDEARRTLNALEEFRPGITLSFVRDHLITTNFDYIDHYIDGLRKAGLPE
jgi:TolB-like protein